MFRIYILNFILKLNNGYYINLVTKCLIICSKLSLFVYLQVTNLYYFYFFLRIKIVLIIQTILSLIEEIIPGVIIRYVVLQLQNNLYINKLFIKLCDKKIYMHFIVAFNIK